MPFAEECLLGLPSLFFSEYKGIDMQPRAFLSYIRTFLYCLNVSILFALPFLGLFFLGCSTGLVSKETIGYESSTTRERTYEAERDIAFEKPYRESIREESVEHTEKVFTEFVQDASISEKEPQESRPEDTIPKHFFPLPKTLDLGKGAASSIKVGDLDGDGFFDLVTIFPNGAQKRIELIIAWGGKTGFNKLTRLVIAKMTQAFYDVRDSATEQVVFGDFNGDKKLDLATAKGFALQKEQREFTWQALPDATLGALLLPVGSMVVNGKLFLIRANTKQAVQRCEPMKGCQTLFKHSVPIQELAVADFDHDGVPDILVGGMMFGTSGASFWSSRRKGKLTILENIHGVDWEVGDINGDGHPDLVTQRQETIPDFPSTTDVWVSKPGAGKGFILQQSIYNFGNHNDNMELVDLDQDGCLDLLQIDVDGKYVGLRYGQKNARGLCAYLGPHDPKKKLDQGRWATIRMVDVMTGVQVLDVNGDGKLELIGRTWYLPKKNPHPKLVFFPLPKPLPKPAPKSP